MFGEATFAELPFGTVLISIGVPIIPEVTLVTTELVFVVEIDLIQPQSGTSIVVHFRFLVDPPANLAAAISKANAALALAQITMIIQSQADLVAPEYLSIDVDTTQEEELWELGLDGVGDNEIVVYFVETITQSGTPFKGWAQIPGTRALVAEDATDYILAHEICHNLGLIHSGNTDNLMYPVTGDITNLPPDLTIDQINIIKSSVLNG